MYKRFKKILGIFLALFVLGQGYIALSIVSFSRLNETPPSDVAIVLGAAVWNDQPSPVFEQRIKHAMKLYQQGLVRKILFTGGIGEGKHYSEAEVARRYALKHHVDANAIVLETRSKTTYQNLLYAQHIMRQQGEQTAIAVSDPLHMKRVVMIGEMLNLKLSSSPTLTSRYRSLNAQTQFLWREMYFYQHQLLRALVEQ